MIKKLSVILIILFTVLVIALKPKLYKTVVFSEVVSKNEPTKEAQIEWNSWHSNILNRIMLDAKTAPSKQSFDTMNYIEFDVDSDKNIINIKIYAEPQQYSKDAKKHFSPYVRALNGDNVLAFPKNSQRKLAHFKGVLKKSKTTQLSTPDDFVDVETIKVKK